MKPLLLTAKTAIKIRKFIDDNLDLLDIDAARMGLSLTGDQKAFIAKKLKPFVKQGREPAKLKATLAAKTKELIALVNQ